MILRRLAAVTTAFVFVISFTTVESNSGLLAAPQDTTGNTSFQPDRVRSDRGRSGEHRSTTTTTSSTTTTQDPTTTSSSTTSTTSASSTSSTTTTTSTTSTSTTTTTAPTTTTTAPTTTAPGSGPSSGTPIGYGRNATGGSQPCVVTTLALDGPGSLMDCAEKGGALVTFAVSGTIDVSSDDIDVASNTTVDGWGQDVTIIGRFDIQQKQNIIVKHLTFTGSNEDSIRAIGSRTMWFDHLEMYASADGLIDITLGSTDVTVSWSHFHHHDKVSLVIGDATTRARVTYHHNWFDNGGRRYPNAEFGDIHGFNNFMDGWTEYGVISSETSNFLSENNVYRMTNNDNAIITQYKDENPGYAWSIGDQYIGALEIQTTGGSWSVPYSYGLDPTSSVVDMVTTRTGPNK